MAMHAVFPEKPVGYYAVFTTSHALRRASETLIREVQQGNWKQQKVLLDVIRLFNSEAAHAYVLNAITAMNLGHSAERFVNSALGTMTTTINRVAAQVVPKLDEKQMQQAALHVQSLTLALPRADGELQPMTGFLVPDYLEQERIAITVAIRDGQWREQRQRCSKLLSELGDLMMDEVYLKSIRLMGFGFLTEKMIQGGVGVARAVQHQLVAWAVSSLEEKEFRQMADYMESLMQHLQEPLPHAWLFYPNE